MKRQVLVALAAAGCGGAPSSSPSKPASPARKAQIVVLDAAPADALVLAVDAKRWQCAITEPDGRVTDTLKVPVGRAVKLVVTTRDQIGSSTGIAVGLEGTTVNRRVREGVVTEIVFRVDHPGTYHWRCPTLVPPFSRDDDPKDPWFDPVKPFQALAVGDYNVRNRELFQQENPQTAEGKVDLGRFLYLKHGCAACHTIDGSPRIGPSWAGIWGSTVTLADGTSRKVDTGYVEQSMMKPSAFARPLFSPVMPSFEGQLKPSEVAALVAFIASLADVPLPPTH